MLDLFGIQTESCNTLRIIFILAEKSCSVHGDGERWDKDKQCVVGAAEMEPDTMIKIIRKGVLRY